MNADASGPVYKLAFGPRSFIVVSDPVMAKHVLKSSVGDYDKGVLAAVREKWDVCWRDRHDNIFHFQGKLR